MVKIPKFILIGAIWFISSGFLYGVEIDIIGGDPFHPEFEMTNLTRREVGNPDTHFGCMEKLEVLDDKGRVVWRISMQPDGSACHRRGTIAYGKIPEDCRELAPPVGLKPGVRYDVNVLPWGRDLFSFTITGDNETYRIEKSGYLQQPPKRLVKTDGCLRRRIIVRQVQRADGSWGGPFVVEPDGYENGAFKEIACEDWFFPWALYTEASWEKFPYWDLARRGIGRDHPGLEPDSPVYIRTLGRKDYNWEPVIDPEVFEMPVRQAYFEALAVSRKGPICNCPD